MEITEDDFHRLNALPPDQRAAAIRAYEANAKTTASEVPRAVQRELMQQAIQLAERAARQDDAQQSAALDLATPPDGFVIAGYAARPMSAGVVQVLERIKHPMIVGGETTLGDIVAILYCLCWPSVGDIVRQAKDGTLNDCATEWAFEIDVDAIYKAYGEIESMFSKMGNNEPTTEKKTKPKRR